MPAHLDKKPSGGVAIAFFVITLLTPVALAILLSRLNAFFEADAVGSKNASLARCLERRGEKGSAAECESINLLPLESGCGTSI
jgi:hypothetical protein